MISSGMVFRGPRANRGLHVAGAYAGAVQLAARASAPQAIIPWSYYLRAD